jgi:hypothetical protein
MSLVFNSMTEFWRDQLFHALQSEGHGVEGRIQTVVASLASSRAPEDELEHSLVDFAAPAHVLLDKRAKRAGAAQMYMPDRPESVTQRAMAHALNQGPKSATQRKQLQSAFGGKAQLVAAPEELADEKLMKTKFAASQLIPAQRTEARGGQAVAQRYTVEDGDKVSQSRAFLLTPDKTLFASREQIAAANREVKGQIEFSAGEERPGKLFQVLAVRRSAASAPEASESANTSAAASSSSSMQKESGHSDEEEPKEQSVADELENLILDKQEIIVRALRASTMSFSEVEEANVDADQDDVEAALNGWLEGWTPGQALPDAPAPEGEKAENLAIAKAVAMIQSGIGTLAQYKGRQQELSQTGKLSLPSACNTLALCVTGADALLMPKVQSDAAVVGGYMAIDKSPDRDSQWDYHFAAVIMKDGDDYITLETAAPRADEMLKKLDSDWSWNYEMYGPKSEEQSFFDTHKASLGRAGEEAQFKAAVSDVSTSPRSAESRSGLPADLQSGVEALSGVSLGDVQVHYNSSEPAQLNALAYAQCKDIHIAPGQEQHLPHEAWHVVQQAQGRVRPTRQMKDRVAINDDASLEREADVMGAKALQLTAGMGDSNSVGAGHAPVQQELPGVHTGAGFAQRRSAGLRGANGKASVAQRVLKVEGVSYSAESPGIYVRHLRRDLMLMLEVNGFPRTGTGRMWAQLDTWINAPVVVEDFPYMESMIARLYEMNLMERRMVQGASMGPRNLGDRPAFATGVTKLLTLTEGPEGESQARRHVISSSTLGRAIEQAPASLAVLNEWLRRHGLEPKSGPESPMNIRAVRMQIWKYVHNHLGNLWVGPSMPNSAIGFIRGPILGAVRTMRNYMVKNDSDTVPLGAIVESLPDKSGWRDKDFSETWNMMRSTLIDRLTELANEHGQDDGAAMDDGVAMDDGAAVDDDVAVDNGVAMDESAAVEDDVAVVDGAAVVEEMVQWIRNADLDMPAAQFGDEYFAKLNSVYARLVFPTEEVFAPGGALDNFLQLSLTSGLKSPSKKFNPKSEKEIEPMGGIIVPDGIAGVGRIENVSGEGMDCLIRSLLVAVGRPDDDATVNILRTYLISQGVAEEGNMLELAGMAGAVLLSYMQAQGLLGDRGLEVYTPGHLDPPIPVIDGGDPIRLWLSGNHFRAIIPH